MAETTRTVAVRRPRVTRPRMDIEKAFLEFVTHWRTASVAGTRRDRANKLIKEWFAKGGDSEHELTVNDAGSVSVEFSEPLHLDGVIVTGLENVRKETSTLDLDRVDAWLDSLTPAKREKLVAKLYRTEVVTTSVFQPDALFALNQDGTLSDELLDSLYETDVTWALTVKKG